MRFFIVAICVFLVHIVSAQIRYELKYLDSISGKAEVVISYDKPLDTGANFIMPRSVPGHYAIIAYDRYVEEMTAYSSDNKPVSFTKDNFQPRWRQSHNSGSISRISYKVNIRKMQSRQMIASDFSIISPGYAGLLNYSIFGWVDGTENMPVKFSIQSFTDWPIYSTIDPRENPSKGTYQLDCTNYYELADGQTILGSAFQVKKFDALVPVYVVSYAQAGKEYLDDFGWMTVNSVAILKDYFGKIPFKHYTVVKQSFVMPSPDHLYGFAMEHLNSMTIAANERSFAAAPFPAETRLSRSFGILHHMGHAFLPLRCYGDRYVPHVLEVPPVIRNIWFNEGFIWFLCADTLKTPTILNVLNYNVYKTDKNIKDMPLILLSETGSTSYAEDFRIGQALFSRGALMASEINQYLIKTSGGKKTMKDVFRYLLDWSEKNKRAFSLEEFPGLLKNATGIDVSSIYRKWLEPIK